MLCVCWRHPPDELASFSTRIHTLSSRPIEDSPLINCIARGMQCYLWNISHQTGTDWLNSLLLRGICTVSQTSGQSNLTRGCIAAAHGRYSLYFTMGRPISLEIVHSHGGSGSHLMHGSLSPPEPTTQTTFQSVQPFFAGLTTVTDRPTARQTDRQTTLLGQ